MHWKLRQDLLFNINSYLAERYPRESILTVWLFRLEFVVDEQVDPITLIERSEFPKGYEFIDPDYPDAAVKSTVRRTFFGVFSLLFLI